MNSTDIKIRECKNLNELEDCVRLQKEAFSLPAIELSPIRHFIVNRNVGGFTLGAFFQDRLIGFSLSIPAFLRGEKAFYSHMTAVDEEFQGFGIGSTIKWEQRRYSLERGVKIIKWTFQPVMSLNAYFNLEKLGAVVQTYKPNFYGTDYATSKEENEAKGIDSDRLFAEWHLESEKVISLSKGESYQEKRKIIKKIPIPAEWNHLLKTNVKKAIQEQKRIREEFLEGFSQKLICSGFEKGSESSKYLLFEK